MKIRFITLGLALLLAACTQAPRERAHAVSAQEVRVSDHYSREAVKSHEVFESDIDGHSIMWVRLTNGEQFPMVCRESQSGIYPIPQSVFATPGVHQWSIMCEPRVRHAYALVRLEFSRRDGTLLMNGNRLKPSAKTRLLISPAL